MTEVLAAEEAGDDTTEVVEEAAADVDVRVEVRVL